MESRKIHECWVRASARWRRHGAARVRRSSPETAGVVRDACVTTIDAVAASRGRDENDEGGAADSPTTRDRVRCGRVRRRVRDRRARGVRADESGIGGYVREQ